MKLLADVFNYVNYLIAPAVMAQNYAGGDIPLPFRPPGLTDILSFAIRAFFVIAGVAALLYLLLGAFAWVTSGGEKDAVKKAQDKIQAAVLGLIIIVAVLAIMVTLEQVIFQQKICVGLTCPITIPSLIQ